MTPFSSLSLFFCPFWKWWRRWRNEYSFNTSFCVQVFSVYLLIPALAYCVVLHIDLLRRQTKKQLHPPLSPAAAAQAGNSLSSDGATLSSPQSQSTSASSAISASHDESVKGYAFNRGRHSGSFFLKIGAAGALLFLFKKIKNKWIGLLSF